MRIFLRCELGDDRFGRRHHLHAERAQPVHDRRRAAAGRGHAPRRGGARAAFWPSNQRRQLEQRLQHIDAQHAVRAEERVRRRRRSPSSRRCARRRARRRLRSGRACRRSPACRRRRRAAPRCASWSASRMVSMNSRIARVCGSSTSTSAISPTLRSHSLPTDTSLENPTPRPRPRDMRLPIMLPLCDTIASRPGLDLRPARARR